jgi:penicillin-binding protein 1A
VGVRVDGIAGPGAIPAPRERARRRRGGREGLLLAVAWAVVGSTFGAALAGAGVLAGPAAEAAREAAALRALLLAPPPLAERTTVYASDGSVLAVLHAGENREPLPLARIPRPVRQAVLAAEDARFFRHGGVDPVALARALAANLATGRIAEGGSTITMQLARLAYLRDRRRTVARKAKEMLLATMLERRLSKDEILEAYLNTVYLGRGAYGVGAAAQAYFGKPAEDLGLAEGALLASLIEEPSALDPAADRGRARARRDAVLRRMRELGMIDDRALREALAEPVRVTPRSTSVGIDMVAPVGASFVEHVKRQLLADPRLGATPAERADRLFRGGLRVHTTLDLRAQRAAERAVASVLWRPGDPAAALAAVEPSTGAIRALVGGEDARGFNLATQARRSPGSAFKVFTLVAAIEAGIPLDRVYAAPPSITFRLPTGEVWTVDNYEGAPAGRLSLLDATVFSINTVYAQVVMEVGPRAVVDVARRMGITSPLDPYPAITIGGLTYGVSPLEMASAYATLANGGVRVPPYAVTRVEDATGRVLLRNGPEPRRALTPEVAAAATDALRQVVARGTGRRALRLGIPAAGKTGTTENYTNSWFVGFTDRLSAAVWIGRPRANVPLYGIHGWPRVYGGSLPAEIWVRFMAATLRGARIGRYVDGT